MRQRRKVKRDTIDKLRARIWIMIVVYLSGGMSKQELWQDIGFSRSTWFNYPKGTVPNERVVNAVEEKYPGTRQILNANLWRILQGKRISETEVQNEFRSFNSDLTADYQFLNLQFWSDSSAIEFPKLVARMGSFLGEGDEHGIHLQIIISLMSFVEDSDVEIWNELCRLYRVFLPDFVTQIHWPFKAEIFDLIDEYVRLREKRGIITIQDPNDSWSWRDQKLEFISVLDEHYSNHLYLLLYDNPNLRQSLPQGLIDNISSSLSFKVCLNEKLMFHAWDLWEPASILLLKLFNLRLIDRHAKTPELCIDFLEQQGFFTPYEQELLNYEFLMHIAKHTKVHVNLDLYKDTIEIISQQPDL